MEFTVREMSARDRLTWAEMRAALWPEDRQETHTEEVDRLLRSTESWGFIVETAEGEAAGFAEIAIRAYANGCDTRPVGFLEGIWVKPEFRRRGIGVLLVEHAERFLVARGFRELGSDTQLDNLESQGAHLAWGFSETERVVYFRKSLKSKP